MENDRKCPEKGTWIWNEGEVFNLTKKRILILSAILLSTMIIVVAYLYTEYWHAEPLELQTANIYIMGDMHVESCTFTLTQEGIFEIRTHTLSIPSTQHKKILSNSQRVKIDKIISQLKENDKVVEKREGCGSILIYATIDGEHYYSAFENLGGSSLYDLSINQELVNLTAELIEIAPVKLKNLKRYVRDYISG